MKNLFKKILCLLALCGFAAHAHAQYVNIPDANFRAFLQGQYPQCFNAQGEMDTTCTAVVTEYNMVCGGMAIANLESIQYFDGLQSLDCNTNQLTSLPALPTTLKTLVCHTNQLTNLPALPTSLEYLDCSGNQLTSLPALPAPLVQLFCQNNQLTSLPVLPATLQSLDCNTNQLTSLPALPPTLSHLDCYTNQLTSLPALPATLNHLNCSYNQLTSLPVLPAPLVDLYCDENQLTSLPALPATLRNLECNTNQLTSLPALPATLRSLECNTNQLTSLPVLPATLQTLYCNTNQLTSLPVLPATLGYLHCQNNQLTSLPVLPATLVQLFCQNNQLTSLPPLPIALGNLQCQNNQLTSLPVLPVALVQLLCKNNQLTSLPSLPNNLQHLNCENNPITCLPFLPNTLIFLFCSPTVTCLPNRPANLTTHYVQNGISTIATLPLCTPNNLNGCLSAARIFGKAYTDTDNNCTVTALDNLQQNLLVKAVNTSTQQVYVGTSDANGLYEIAVPVGDYAVSVVQPSVYWTACGGVQTVVITQDGQQEQRDVLVQPVVPCADMEIDHQIQNLARPCSTAVYKVSYFNSGTIASAGAFAKITLPAELTLQSMTRPYTALGGGIFEIQLPSVAALQRDTFSFSASVACTAVMTQMLCTEVEILPHTFCNAGLSGWDGSDVSLTGRCVGQDSVRFILTNIGNGGMATGRSYGVVEDNVMIRSSTFQLPVGGKDSITIAADPRKIYRMIAAEAPNNPSGNTQETFLVWGCQGINNQIHWGFVNQFGLNNGSTNPHNLCTPVRTSFDPNDISAVAEGTTAQHFILKNTDLEYKIRFQNTGNDTAFVVRVIDKIPAELDLTTLRVGAASHPMTYSLKANGTLEFLFQNIKLEDSTSNETKSHGFVTYKIKTKPNIVVGNIINNQAFIYFDANAPVLTNTYTHTIGENLSTIFIATMEMLDNQEFSVKIMPNPMHDAAVFAVETGHCPVSTRCPNLTPELTLYNTLGQVVKTQRFQENTLLVQRDNLPQGCYFYKITSDGKMLAQGKLMVQ